MRRLLLALPVLLMLSAQAPAPKAPAPVSKPKVDLVQQCRSACDKRYYFCLAEAEPEACSPQWAQCRNKCLRR